MSTPKLPKKRNGRVVALVGTTAFRCAMPPIVKLDTPHEALIDQAPVFILPADTASVERMADQMAYAGCESLKKWRGYGHYAWPMIAADMLAAIGIKSKGVTHD